MQLNDVQEEILARLSAAAVAEAAERLTIDAELKALKAERLLERRIVTDKIAAEAHQAGVPLRRIGAQCGTTDYATIRKRVDHGSALIEPLPEVEPQASVAIEPFTISEGIAYVERDGEVVGFTLDGDSLAPVGDDSAWGSNAVIWVMQKKQADLRAAMIDALKRED